MPEMTSPSPSPYSLVLADSHRSSGCPGGMTRDRARERQEGEAQSSDRRCQALLWNELSKQDGRGWTQTMFVCRRPGQESCLCWVGPVCAREAGQSLTATGCTPPVSQTAHGSIMHGAPPVYRYLGGHSWRRRVLAGVSIVSAPAPES